MAERSIIAWTDNTFNPWMGCIKISPGCKNCYALTLTKNRMGLTLWGPKSERQVTSPTNWKKPLAWNREAERNGKQMRVFCGSLCDWMEDHPTANAARPSLWNLIRATPHLDWQLLTKRADRIADNLPSDWGTGYPNVWLGVSIESRDYLWRMEMLKTIPAAIHFISFEPLLESVSPLDLSGIEWVIVGGESGPGFRPMDHRWAREIRDACRISKTAYFFKQSAAPRTEMGIRLQEADGQSFLIREYPTIQTSTHLPATLFS